MNAVQVDTREVQADVLPGFRKGLQALVLVALPARGPAARDLIGGLVSLVTRADQAIAANHERRRRDATLFKADRPPLASHSLPEWWINVGLTHAGLEAIECRSADEKVFAALRLGRDKLRSIHPGARWLTPLDSLDLHVVINIAADDEALLAEALGRARTVLDDHGGRELHTCFGSRLDAKGEATPYEHFGFRDGLSNISVRGFHAEVDPGASTGRRTYAETLQHGHPPTYDKHAPRKAHKKQRSSTHEGVAAGESDGKPADFDDGAPLVQPGQVLLGESYPVQSLDDPRGAVARPAGDGTDDALLANGSFMVWLRLEQDIKRFRESAEDYANQLNEHYQLGSDDFPAVTRLDAEALFVGRRQDGAPLVASPVFARGSRERLTPAHEDLATNAFLYDAPTAKGGLEADPYTGIEPTQCPMWAHVRKTNPRRIESLAALMIRRSIPFDRSKELSPAEATADADENLDRGGLHFICYQASIEHQFEEIQFGWVNRAGEPDDTSPLDLFTSAAAMQDERINVPEAARAPFGPADFAVGTGFVAMTGGAYFFVPSMTALRGLADGRFSMQDPPEPVVF